MSVRLLLLLIFCSSSSCVSVQYGRERLDLPPTEEAIASLVPGTTQLQECLDLLGAPKVVEPTQTGERLTLAWVWNAGSGWGFGVSVPLGEQVNASFQYDDVQSDLPRLQLRFDGEGVLQSVELPTTTLPASRR